MRYDAFISYRHTPLDMEMAKKVHTGLETYHVPGAVKKKTGKALLKSIISSATEMNVAEARKFLVQTKLKKLDEVAFMTDAEVSKSIATDYAFLYIGTSESELVKIAIPREELKKVDWTQAITI